MASAALLPALGAAPRPVSGTATGTRILPGVLVFKLKANVKPLAGEHRIAHPALEAALRAVGAGPLTQKFPRAVAPDPKRTTAEGVDLQLVYQIRYNAAQPFARVRARLLASGALAYVEPLYERNVLFQPNDPLADSVGGLQYHLKNIRAYRAWDIEQGDTTMVIGVTDTGTQFSHQDLTGREARNYADPINGLDDDNDGYVDNFQGWDVADHDNNPSCDAGANTSQPFHGVLVTGALAAHTNNGRGVAGAAFKCRYLPIKIYATTAEGGFAGYEGIVYAADHGCKVINCSWGGPGAPSQFEQDVITYATVNRDAVVVAAAGNTPADLDLYPASYTGVLSVASVDRNDIKGPSNTWAYRISLAAPGRQVGTTYSLNDSAYIAVSGSSFASPLVAGTVALVRHHFPLLSGIQAAERVRITADTSIYTLTGNAPYRERLGRGRLNMRRALGDTAVRSVRVTRSHFNRVRPYYAGDTLVLTADLLNYLAPLRGLTVTLSSPSPNVRILASTFSAGPLPTLGTATNAAQPFRLVLLPGTPVNAVVPLRYGLRDASGYTDYQYISIEVNPDYVTLDANRLEATVTSRGNIGFDNGNLKRGDGVSFDSGDQLLSEGGLLIGRDSLRVSDMLRGTTVGRPDKDFATIDPIRFRRPTTVPGATQQAEGVFQDSARTAQANVRVVQRAWAGNTPGNEQTVFVAYDIINRDATPLTTGYAGLFADWDVYQYEHNRARWNPARRLAYVSAVTNDSVYTGLQLLSSQPATTYAFDNYDLLAAPVRIADGLTTTEKYRALRGGTSSTTTAGDDVIGSDVAQLVSARLPALASGDTVRVAFALLVARSLPELLAAADSAQAAYNFSVLPVPTAPLATNAARCGAGAVTLTAAGAPTGATYRWYAQAVGGNAISGQTGATFTTPGLSISTTYYVAVRSAGGRESLRVPITATVSPLPMASLAVAGPTTFCAGDSVRLLGPIDPGLTVRFLLNDQPTTIGVAGAVLTARQSGAYALVVTNAAGCSDTASAVTVTVNPVPSAAFSYAAPAFCLGGAASVRPTISGAAGGTFSATPAGLVFDTATGALNLLTSSAGIYTITYTAAGPCPAVQTQPLTLTAPPVAQIQASGPVAFCAGDSVRLSAIPAPQPGATYRWSNGATTTSIRVTTSATLTVTVSSAAGCATTSAPVTVAVEALPTAPVLTQVTQPNGTVLLTATGGPTGGSYQFLLNGVALPVAGASTYLITTPGPSGPYALTASSPTGCTSAPSTPLSVLVVTGTRPNATGLTLDLYPNPASRTAPAQLVLRGVTGGQATVTVRDPLGRCVLTCLAPVADDATDRSILTLPALPAGVYTVQVSPTNGAPLTRRLTSE